MDATGRGDRGSKDIQKGSSWGESGQPAPVDSRSAMVRMSRLALVASALAVVSVLLTPGVVHVWGMKGAPSLFERLVYGYGTYATSISAAVLGLISLARIALSAGRLVGRAFASIGIAAPVVQWLALFVLVLLAGPTDVFYGMTCDTNLRGIGNAMLLYANDYEDQLPRAGGRNSQWGGHTPNWAAANRRAAFGLAPDGSGGQATIGASLYLLVKYSEVTPKSFICAYRETSIFADKRWTARTKEDHEEGITEFRVDTYPAPVKKAELIDFWDFGPDPSRHISYAYHMPYGPYSLTTSGPPGFVVAADRNPWMDSPSTKAKDFTRFKPDIPPFNGTTERGKHGNTFRHNGDGQNVLFLDGHAEFAKRAYRGLDDDNIYTISTNPTTGDPLGTPPKLGSQPANARDSLLVNDPPASRK